ncbi:MAG: c-type cytochrome [Bryobacteraceae bacterium]
MMGIRVSLLLALFASFLPAQHDDEKNPHQTPADIEAGGRIYHSHCAECHGIRGEGGRGPDLTRGDFRHGASDGALLRTISKGIAGTEMPGVYFSDDQVWQVVAFVKSLSGRQRPVKLPGSVSEGEKLYRKNGCGRCHLVRGEGGRLGPDLSDVGAQRTAAFLKTALTRPQQQVLPSYWQVRVTGKDGKAISGILMNEDHVSLQMIDSEENLRSLLKSDLASFKVDKASMMPSYERTLGAKELDDVVAYLASLRRDGGTR